MASNKTQSGNSSGVCTWGPISACDDCPIAGDLQCRFKWQDLLSFVVNFAPFGIASVAGMIRGGFAWYLVGWLTFAILFFFGCEARVLCSHCPYWAEGGRILHCHGNAGALALNLIRNTSVRCVNFSCPLNRVPKPTVDAYLRRNPVMCKAWEASGYRLDESMPASAPDCLTDTST